jgi:hypothetical protein
VHPPLASALSTLTSLGPARCGFRQRIVESAQVRLAEESQHVGEEALNEIVVHRSVEVHRGLGIVDEVTNRQLRARLSIFCLELLTDIGILPLAIVLQIPLSIV